MQPSFKLVDAAVVLVDAGAPAVLALALAAFMLADAGAPAVLALAPAAGADTPADADEYCSILFGSRLHATSAIGFVVPTSRI